MRLLPRTARGTWTLAAATWLAACAIAWTLLPLQPLAEWPLDAPLQPVGFIPGRRTFVAGPLLRAGDGAIESLRSFDADTGQVTEWATGDDEIRARATILSPDGRWATVALSRNGKTRLHLFDAVTGQDVVALPHADDAEFVSATFSPNSGLLVYSAIGAPNSTIHIWDVAAGVERDAILHEGGRIVFAPNGHTIAIVDEGQVETPQPHRIRVWDVTTGRRIAVLEGPLARGCWQLHFTPDSQRLAVVFWGVDNATNPATPLPPGRTWPFVVEVRCWDISNGTVTFRLGCDQVEFPRNQNRFVTQTNGIRPNPNLMCDIWSYDGVAQPCNVVLGPNQWVYSDWTQYDAFGGNSRLLAVATRSNSSKLAQWLRAIGIRVPFSTSVDGSLRFIDLETGAVAGSLPPWREGDIDDGRGPEWLVFAPDADMVAVTQNRQLRIWQIPAGRPWGWLTLIAIALAAPMAATARWHVRLLACPSSGETPPAPILRCARVGEPR
jgi:WD40 repeat protein